MGTFWYPFHWSDLAPDAFVQAPADHDSHGFGSDFVARQEDRDRALEDYLNNLSPGGGKRYATVVVAASNSLHHAAADADFVCSGSGDQATINSAIGSLPSGGGTVLLMEGTYAITGQILVEKSNVRLLGMGSSTVISASGGGYNAIYLHKGVTNTVDHCTVQNLKVTGTCTYAVQADGYANTIVDCDFDTITGAGVYCTSNNSNYIVSRNFFRSVSGISVTIGGGQSIVTGNQFLFLTADAVHIQQDDCIVADNYLSGGTGRGVYTSGTRTKISNNNVSVGNTVGIYIDAAVDCFVTNNTVRGSGTAGVQIITGSSACIVVNNDLHGSGTTPIVDAGTGTLKNLDGSANSWNRV